MHYQCTRLLSPANGSLVRLFCHRFIAVSGLFSLRTFVVYKATEIN